MGHMPDMTLHGDANWSSEAALHRAGLTSEDGNGIILGSTMQSFTPISDASEDCIFTLGPRGSGKTASLVIPTLLTYRHSVIVTDPKGALTAQTARRRKELGNRVVVLNPWRDELAKDENFSRDLGDTGFNPLARLTTQNPSLFDDVDDAAAMLCPTPHDARDPSWTDAGRSILGSCLLFLALSPNHTATLPALYSLTRRTLEEWEDLCLQMEALDADIFASRAREILEPLSSPKQWAGVKQAINNATAIYAPNKALAKHVERDEFDPADLKREAVTVFIVIPARRREANKQWLALVMQSMAEAVGRPGVARPVLLLAEEFQNLGYLPLIGKAMAEYREAGLRAWLIVQNIPELRRLYGADGANALIANCGIKQYLCVSDQTVAEELERVIGKRTAIAIGSNSGSQSGFSGQGFSSGKSSGDSTSQVGVPLMLAQDIRNMPRHETIIIMGGDVLPIRAYLVGYFNRQDWLNMTDPNPYRDEPEIRTALPFLDKDAKTVHVTPRRTFFANSIGGVLWLSICWIGAMFVPDWIRELQGRSPAPFNLLYTFLFTLLVLTAAFWPYQETVREKPAATSKKTAKWKGLALAFFVWMIGLNLVIRYGALPAGETDISAYVPWYWIAAGGLAWMTQTTFAKWVRG